MGDWTETAKLLAAHPRWEWCEGVVRVPFGRWGGVPARRVGRVGDVAESSIRRSAHPDLTDWATVGVLLGMLMGEVQSSGVGDQLQSRLHAMRLVRLHDRGGPLGEAVALALMEVWGDG